MSGFLPDLANWALSGGAGEGNNNENNNEEESNNNTSGGGGGGGAAAAGSNQAQLGEDEVRARRLARMEAMMSNQSSATAAAASSSDTGPTPMDVDSPAPTSAAAAAAKRPAAASATPMDISTGDASTPKKSALPAKKKASPKVATPREGTPSQQKKKAKESHSGNPSDTARKLQRKKEMLIKKVLGITLKPATDPACVAIELDDSTVGVQNVAEILATRLALSPDQLTTMPPQKPLIAYLAQAHLKAGEELKSISSSKKDTAEREELLQEVQRQVVSYAASSLMEPDLFEQAQDGVTQLSDAIMHTHGDPTQSITFGLSGVNTSFYYLLCEELFTQDKATLDRVIAHVVKQISAKLAKCDTIDSGLGPIGLVTALINVCSNKKAALAVAEMDSFLVPEAGTPAASEMIRPTPAGADLLRSMLMVGENRPYQKRSGPALEKQTLLGLCLRISSPKNNPAFSPTSILRQSLDSVERTTNQQRQQLRMYQEACNQLIRALIKGGAVARGKVLKWFTDCLLVNPGATAMRPDPTKVSASSLLLNTSVVLLKLCEPFVLDEKKFHLIDPGFVSSADDNGGIFPTSGDDMVPRLGDASAMEETPASPYAPKNAFIPQCFFFAARSLALGIVPMLSSHENLLRHISHQHYELTSNNRDIHSDAQFCIMVSKQRSIEVALFQEEMVTDTFHFCNLMAKMLLLTPDDSLQRMPEHFVDNVCDILMSVAKMKPKLLRGMELRYVFQLVVKLLSPTYATVSVTCSRECIADFVAVVVIVSVF